MAVLPCAATGVERKLTQPLFFPDKTDWQGYRVPLIILLAFLLAVLWLLPYLPMTDLPEHILAGRVFLDYQEEEPQYEHYFTRSFPWQPYSSTYFWFLWLLRPLIGIEAGTRLFLSLALGLTIPAFVSWVRVFDPSRAVLAIPATLLLYGSFFYVGMVNFLFSVPFLFWGWAFAGRIRSGDRSRGLLLKLAGALLLVYFSHVVALGIALLGLAAQEAALRHRPGAWAARMRIAGALLPVAVLTALHFILTEERAPAAAFSWSYESPGMQASSLLLPFAVFYDRIGGRWVWFPETLLIWFLVLALAFAGWRRGKRRAGLPPAGLFVCAGVLAAATLLSPYYVAGHLAVAYRISYPAAFALLALLPVAWYSRPGSRRLVVFLCAAAPLAVLWRSLPFQAEMRDLERVAAVIPAGQVIQPVVTELNSPRLPTYPHLHSANWCNYWKGGTNPYTFGRFSYFPVRDRLPFIPNPPPEWDMGRFQYGLHQQGSDYFLVKTRRLDIIEDLSQNVPLAAQAGAWRLFGPNRAAPAPASSPTDE
jgi:hypothetical protein